MGLQLRVRDGIRSRVVQVEPRGPERPLRIGSDAACDIRLGMGAAIQCELFVHRGRWAVRNVAGDPAVRVGGKVVSSGAYLNPDDRITLGDSPDAAVIEVGPVAGVAGGAAARPAGPDAIAELAAAGEEDGAWLREDPDEYVPLGDALTPAAARTVRARKKRRSSSGVGWTVGMALLLAAGGGAALWKLRPRDEPGTAPIVRKAAGPIRTTAPATSASRRQESIFDSDWRTTAEKRAADSDPRKHHADWLAVEKAVNGPSAARAILAIRAYQEAHPGQFEAELQGYLDEAIDRIWWQRIKELCERRDELRGEIRKLSDAIAEETDDAFRMKLEAERAATEGVLRWELEMLTREMGFAGTEAPNVADEEMIRHLRGERDSALYAAWKEKVMKSVVATRGYLPWERAK